LLPQINPNFKVGKSVNLFNEDGYVTKDRLMNNIFNDKDDKHGLKESKKMITEVSS